MADRLLYAASASFESARRIEGAPAGAREGRLHGHSFRARLLAHAPLTEEGGAALAPFAGAEVDALRARLQERIAPLDYQLLNEHIAAPTDANLARWLQARLELRGLELVGVSSTRHAGVDLYAGDREHVWRRYQIEAAHWLPKVPADHKCARLHGHGFGVVLHAHGGASVQPVDGTLLDTLWAPLQRELQHACLNEIPGLENPTSECLAHWIWRRVRGQLPALHAVTVRETASSGAHFDGERYQIWKEFGLDSAVRLRNAPAGDARGRIHGHTYRLRLHLSAALDRVYGWIVDFGDVKELFAPVFARVDHQPLQELPGVADAGAPAIARWVRQQASAGLPQLERIDLYETAGCGVVLAWGPRPVDLVP